MVLPNPKYQKPEARRAFYDEALRRLQEIPAVESAGMISFLPLSFTGMNFSFSVEGRPVSSDAELPMALYRVVSPNYFNTMRIPLLRGRFFDAHDTQDSLPVVVINRQLADRFWPNEDPTGKRLKVGPADSPNPWAIVIGVVGNVRQSGLYGDQISKCTLPIIRIEGALLRQRIWWCARKVILHYWLRLCVKLFGKFDKDQPISNIRTMEQVFAETVSRERFQMLLLMIFASLALVLACVGLYGVISYAAVQRTREIGIRMALGAQRKDVLQLVIKQGIAITLIGIIVGLFVALGVMRIVSGMLYQVTATDPVTFIGVAVLLIVVAVLACYLPAHRATKIDPLKALRYE
jgi:putative ABC transport system permease protein